MPTYEYVCRDCGVQLEVVQSFRDDSLEICSACGGRLRKVFGNVGLVFKGSGFYKTDSRSSSTSTKSSSSDNGKSGSSSDGSTTTSNSSGSSEGNSSKSDSGESEPVKAVS